MPQQTHLFMKLPCPTHRLGPTTEQDRTFRLGVVIPLKARSVSRCWAEVMERLQATVASLCHQSSTDWDAVIVCHDRPEIDLATHPNLAFHTIETPPPSGDAEGRISDVSKLRDFAAKKAVGMRLLAARGTITHWFHLDADDLLHEDFVATLSRMVPFDIAVVRKGYAYYPQRCRYRDLDRIDHFCGSTVITSDRWWLDAESGEGRRYGGIHHQRVDACAETRGVPVREYPGRGVAYVLGYGDNNHRTLSRRVRVWFEERFRSRPCDAEFVRAFGPSGGNAGAGHGPSISS